MAYISFHQCSETEEFFVEVVGLEDWDEGFSTFDEQEAKAEAESLREETGLKIVVS